MLSVLTEIRDFLPLTEQMATGGQPTIEQFSDIQRAGYAVIINLVPASSPNFLQEEPEIVTRLGMEYAGISVDWGAPTESELRQFCDTMHCHRQKKIFVHCAANKRVSVFVFLYRVLCLQMDEADAEDDLEKVWIPEGTWRAFLNEMLFRKSAFIK